MKNSIVFLLGFVVSMALTVGIPMVESAIPPTPAIKSISVLTDRDVNNFTDINATLYNDRLPYFVSDGSIWFNVTESYP